MDLKEHLKTLTELTGPQGHEEAVRHYLREQWAEYVDDFEVDGFGSLISIKRGSGPEPRKRIMLCAHMDEIGMLVANIKNGYLRLSDIWGIDNRILLGKLVLIHTRSGILKGLVASVPPHISNSKGGADAYPDWEELWVDLGLPAEEVAQKVRIGDIVTMDAPAIDLMGDKVAGKAMDDRACVAAVTACLGYLKSRKHDWDVYAVASTQEETGLFGAATAAYKVQPDLAIALDVAFAQQPGVNGDEYPKHGSAPVIAIGPNLHEGLNKGLQDTAKKLEMSLFTETYTGNTGTDAWSIQVSRAGIPTALLGVPIRNMHTPVETVLLKDIDRTGRLMADFIAGLTDEFLDKITWKPAEVDKGDKKNGADK
ncbi:MAG: M20/M25/M40 family metallo-hydrolase [Chloroflexi bacterium]|nr:M20/M25/M40 family metallo-hydrolase [Chloroflexota bacterium]